MLWGQKSSHFKHEESTIDRRTRQNIPVLPLGVWDFFRIYNWVSPDLAKLDQNFSRCQRLIGYREGSDKYTTISKVYWLRNLKFYQIMRKFHHIFTFKISPKIFPGGNSPPFPPGYSTEYICCGYKNGFFKNVFWENNSTLILLFI